MYCSSCGKPANPDAQFCSHCGNRLAAPPARRAAADVEAEAARRPRRPAAADEDDEDEEEGGGAVATIIPYKNASALAAYYLGIFSLVPLAAVVLVVIFAALQGGKHALAFLGIASPLGLLLGPLALLLGILGIRKATTSHGAKGTGHGVVGTVIGLITTLLCLAALGYFLSDLEFHRRVLREWWKELG